MTKNRMETFAVFCLVMLLSSCAANRYKRYETKNYSLSSSHTVANVYLNKNGDICEKPFLPCGLFICLEKDEPPQIDYQLRREDVGTYPIFNILKVYDTEEHIIVVTDKDFKLINKDDVLKVKTADDVSMEKSNLIFNAEWVAPDFADFHVQNAFSLQDKRQNRKFHVDYSTPAIDGITKIGLYEKHFYFGETLHSYFVLVLNTDEIKFFRDKDEYASYCKEKIVNPVEILESIYGISKI